MSTVKSGTIVLWRPEWQDGSIEPGDSIGEYVSFRRDDTLGKLREDIDNTGGPKCKAVVFDPEPYAGWAASVWYASEASPNGGGVPAGPGDESEKTDAPAPNASETPPDDADTPAGDST